VTRVAGIPTELQGLAATLVGSGPELELAAAALASAPIPAMPSGVAGQVTGWLSEATTLLARSAKTAGDEGTDLKRRGLWLEIADRIKEGWEPVSVGVGMFATPTDGVNTASAWRVEQLLRAWDAYQDAVSPAVAAEGESSLAALNAQLQFEEDNAMAPGRFATILEGAGDESAYLDSLGSLAGIADTVGKVTPVFGVIGGTVELVDPKHHHGALMVADRTAGLATAAGSTAILLDAAAILPMAPAAAPIIIGVVVAAGVWELYENREEVAKLTVAGAKFVANHAYVLAGPAGIAAKEAWDYRKPIAHTLVSAADTGKDLAEDGAKTIVGGAESAGSTAVSTAKSILGHVDVPHVHVGGLSFP
jgi:hypothetical protein